MGKVFPIDISGGRKSTFLQMENWSNICSGYLQLSWVGQDLSTFRCRDAYCLSGV
jgi:hypothetical protein